MSLKQLLVILRGRWRIVLAIFLSGILLAVAASILLPKQYIANASVVVDVRPDPLGNPVYAGQPASYLATQIDIITSQSVAERVVKMLSLDQDPAVRQQWLKRTSGKGDLVSWEADGLRRQLSVNPARDSNVITISVTSPDRKSAAAVANAFAQAYIDTSVQLRVEPAKQDAASFDERYRALLQDLESKQKLLSDYQNEHGIVPSDERINTENSRLAELSSQLVVIQGQRQDTQSRQAEASHAADASPEVQQSPVIIALKTELARAQVQQQQIATSLGTGHPQYISLQADIDGLHDRIAQESQRVVASLQVANRVNSQRERAISTAIENQKQRILDLTHQRDEAANLQNDVLRAQHNLDAVSQHLAQSSLESQTRQSSIVLLTAASEPARASSPKLVVNLALGMFVGGALGLGIALLIEMEDRRVRTDDELLSLAGVPALGTLRRSKPSRQALGFADPGAMARLNAPQARGG